MALNHLVGVRIPVPQFAAQKPIFAGKKERYESRRNKLFVKSSHKRRRKTNNRSLMFPIAVVLTKFFSASLQNKTPSSSKLVSAKSVIDGRGLMNESVCGGDKCSRVYARNVFSAADGLCCGFIPTQISFAERFVLMRRHAMVGTPLSFITANAYQDIIQVP